MHEDERLELMIKNMSIDERFKSTLIRNKLQERMQPIISFILSSSPNEEAIQTYKKEVDKHGIEVADRYLNDRIIKEFASGEYLAIHTYISQKKILSVEDYLFISAECLSGCLEGVNYLASGAGPLIKQGNGADSVVWPNTVSTSSSVGKFLVNSEIYQWCLNFNYEWSLEKNRVCFVCIDWKEWYDDE